jgi:hypothetical protein
MENLATQLSSIQKWRLSQNGPLLNLMKLIKTKTPLLLMPQSPLLPLHLLLHLQHQLQPQLQLPPVQESSLLLLQPLLLPFDYLRIIFLSTFVLN